MASKENSLRWKVGVEVISKIKDLFDLDKKQIKKHKKLEDRLEFIRRGVVTELYESASAPKVERNYDLSQIEESNHDLYKRLLSLGEALGVPKEDLNVKYTPENTEGLLASLTFYANIRIFELEASFKDDSLINYSARKERLFGKIAYADELDLEGDSHD